MRNQLALFLALGGSVLGAVACYPTHTICETPIQASDQSSGTYSFAPAATSMASGSAGSPDFVRTGDLLLGGAVNDLTFSYRNDAFGTLTIQGNVVDGGSSKTFYLDVANPPGGNPIALADTSRLCEGEHCVLLAGTLSASTFEIDCGATPTSPCLIQLEGHATASSTVATAPFSLSLSLAHHESDAAAECFQEDDSS